MTSTTFTATIAKTSAAAAVAASANTALTTTAAVQRLAQLYESLSPELLP